MSKNATTTISGLPVYTDWPPVVIEPLEKEVEEPEEDDDGFITTCHLWFFSVSIYSCDFILPRSQVLKLMAFPTVLLRQS